MKKVITMVGTSLFENYLDKKEDNIFKEDFEDLKDDKVNAENLDRYSEKRERIERALNETWFRKNK
ncbi:MAG: hypothetical protein ACP5HC_08105 [Caldisericum sp.]